MSLDAMDIDPAPLSPERKRKNKEKDRHSAKKRKHQVTTTTAQPDVEESSPKAKKKEKKEKKHKKHKYHEGLEASARALPDTPNSRSKKPKKPAHQSHQAALNDDWEQEEQPSKPQSQSPTTSRKPLSKASVSQLESTSADSTESSAFHLITATLYVPLSPISISPTHALSSLQAEHLSPLLLTYYPPLRGIVLAYSNAFISSSAPSPTSPPTPPHNPDEDLNPQPLTLAVSAGEYGVLYVYLTATFLIFRPERGQLLEGWINVQSDGFLGAVVYNLFSVGIERRRLPADWQWVAPGEESTTAALGTTTPKRSSGTDDDDDDDNEDKDSDFDSDKENFRPLPATSSTILDLNAQNHNHEGMEPPFEAFEDAAAGYFRTRSGRRVRGMVRFRVRDVDVIPGAEHDKGFLSIEGTMLSAVEEAKLLEEERRRAALAPLSSSSSSSAVARARAGAGRSGDEVPPRAMMSGGLGIPSAAATAAAASDDDADDDLMEVEPEAELPVPVPGKQGKDKEKKKKTKVKKTTS
ncbi:hypothetical protein RJZ56_004088 [Blastomyces dermatitidis]